MPAGIPQQTTCRILGRDPRLEIPHLRDDEVVHLTTPLWPGDGETTGPPRESVTEAPVEAEVNHGLLVESVTMIVHASAGRAAPTDI